MKSFFPTIGMAAAIFALLQYPSASSAGSAVTLYLDGAIVEQSESARKGYIELLLPPSARTDSLKIKPKPGTTISRVVVKSRKPSKGRDQEIVSIQERQDLLHDRIKALSVREEIFKSAAKSQSGKAPRKTKTNPEPIAGIRQGTDYAIAQLEGVYTAKRKAEKELKLLEEKRSLLANDEQSAGNYAKIWVSPSNGSVTASWSQSDRNWTPSYELRADSVDKFRFYLFANEFHHVKGEKVTLDLSSLNAPSSTPGYRLTDENGSVKLDSLKISGKPEDLSRFPVTIITSDAKGNLPPGDISCYRDGEYLGTGRFPGLETGRALEFRCTNH
jgi:hypothetical protein